MPTIQSQFRLKHYDGYGGNFTDSDYLAASYDGGKPHVMENMMGKIFTSSDRFNNKPLLGMTLAKEKKKEIANEIFRWKMQTAEEKTLRVIENLEVGNPTPGLGGTEFRVKLDEDWYQYPDVVMSEDNEFHMEVMDGPYQDGNGYIYTLRLQTDDLSRFLPADLLFEGKEFRKMWTTVSSEYNGDYGTMQHSGHNELESQVSFFAQKHTITDKAMREGGRLGVPIPYVDKAGNRKTSMAFAPYAEMKMQDELYMGMEAQMMYGKRSSTTGRDGYWKKTGPGLRQQLQDGHIEYYSGVLTEARLKDYLLDIFLSRVNEGDRKIVAMTGTGGSIMFHDMLASSAQSFFTMDTHFITKIKDNPRHLSYGAQFTHYQGPEGIEVTVIKNPLYDDRKYCPRLHPIDKKLPIDSYRFTFLDFGKADNEDNIQYLCVKDTFKNFFIPGSVTPTGPVKGGMTVSAKGGYESFIEGSAGIWVRDVTRTGEIIFDAD